MSEAPPPYDIATGDSTASSHPQEKTGSSLHQTQTAQEERRPIPRGWIRQFDSKENHEFYVDTSADPPRSIWHHPYDDEQYMSTLSSEERERLQEEEDLRQKYGSKINPPSSKPPAKEDTLAPPRPDQQERKKSFGRKLKDKVTGTTHEERQADRARRDEEEREYYDAQMRYRSAMQQAISTGQPQFFAKDRDGKDIYIEPPSGPGAPYGRGYGYQSQGQGNYGNPNVRYIRPQYRYGYGPGYGGGYGGGYGLPLAGGLLGGALLGSLLF